MTREEIIKEILKRFKLDSNSLRTLELYEYDLIYSALSGITRDEINKAIEGYKSREFQVKTIRTSFY